MRSHANGRLANQRILIGLLAFVTSAVIGVKATWSADVGKSCEPDPHARSDSTAATLDELVPELMAKLHVPGVSIVGIEDRRIAWERQYGVRRAGSTEKVDRDTVFEACSMSKLPLAYLALKLVERGKLDLNKPLVEYLDKPYLADQPLHKRITTRMVLSHTTGFPNWRDGGWRRGGPLPVLFEPGTRFGYSGEGFLYLQRVIEHLTGAPFEEYIKDELFEPLKITISSYVWRDCYEKLAAAGHDSQGQVKPKRRLYRRANAGYSLYCTPHEYAKFLVEILKEDRTAAHSLSTRSVDLMLTRTTEATGRKPIKRSGETMSDTVHWGLGWAINRTAAGDRVYHSGSNGTGFRCYCEFDRARGTGIVIMTNAVSGRELWEHVIAAVAPP
ncbi:MAG: serine hydrolase domain-containing protein [Planctomycetota bacterium]